MTDLERRIKEASQAYYSSGTSELSDDEFDALMHQLEIEQPDSELLKATGSGYEVELDSTPGDRVAHIYGPAVSLDKSYTWKELKYSSAQQWVDASAKLDGLTAVAYIQKGKLILGLTRGEDGLVGIDITEKLKYLIGDDFEDDTFTGAVKGEIVMTWANFEKFKASRAGDKNPPKHPRNSACGLINGKEVTDDFQYLSYVAYQVIGHPSMEDPSTVASISAFKTYFDWQRDWLFTNFKDVAPRCDVLLSEATIEHTLRKLHDEWYKIYPLDGVVLSKKDNQFEGAYVTYDAKAFKFAAESKKAKVLGIHWRMSRFGTAVPRINIEPTDLSGSLVNFCTGYNAKYLVDNRIDKGAVITVSRRGEIIPNPDEVIEPAEHVYLPDRCNHCFGDLEWNTVGSGEVGVHLYCPNPLCSCRREGDLLVWTSTLAPIKGLGDDMKLDIISDIFGASVTIGDMMSPKVRHKYPTEGANLSVARKNVHKMLNRLYGYDDVMIPLDVALQALNIPRLGSITAKKLSEHTDIVRELMDNSLDLGYKVSSLLEAIVGSATATSIEVNLIKFSRLGYITQMIDWEGKPISDVKGSVVITGTIYYSSRSEFAKLLEKHGYKVSNSIKGCICLITNNPDSGTAKCKAAVAANVPIMSEADFMDTYIKGATTHCVTSPGKVKSLF